MPQSVGMAARLAAQQDGRVYVASMPTHRIVLGAWEELRSLTERVASLPVDLRVPLVLRDVEGFSKEVADALGVTVPAAESRIHRARMQLREAYDGWRGGEG